MKLSTFALAGLAALLPVFAWSADPDATKSIHVPATANGNFGNCANGCAPSPALVKAISVPAAGVIVVTQTGGTWCGTSDGNYCTDANGLGAVLAESPSDQTPLQEASGTSGVYVTKVMALMGAFVPRRLAETAGFVATDATKLSSGAGISPNLLFFVGKDNTFQVSGPGTLFLGANDWLSTDNTGGITVQATFYRN